MTPQELKNSLLQRAIQGRLVPQDPTDEPASVLLDKIRKEKAKLLKAGKIKKEKPLPEITDEEIPFDIPENWTWVRWGEIVNIVSARRVHQSDWKTEGIPFYRAREIAKLAEFGHVDNELFISEELFNEFAKSGIPQPNDIMVTAVGTLGKAYIVKPEDHFYYKDASVICLENFGKIIPEYLKYLMQSEMMLRQIQSNSNGTTVATLTLVRMAEYLLPLPPLSEQRRIVSKLEELLPLVESYAQAWNRLEELNRRFPDDMRKAILQHAIQGRLVPQDPTDEPASVLLDKIRKEKAKLIKAGKIKKEKPLPEITEEEIPFDIPESWMWCYVGDLFQHNTGKALNGSDKCGTPMTYITTSNLYWDRFELDKLKEMPFTENEVEKCTVQKGDLLVCEGGDFGRSAIWPYDYPTRIQNHIHRLRAYGTVSIRYFYYIFYLYKNAGLIAGKGIGIQGLSSNALHALKVPLPPLAEQKRIVSKLEELLPLCDQLKQRIS